LKTLANRALSVNYMYAIHFANATFAFANLARPSNFHNVETARNKGRSGRKRVRGNHLTPVEAAFRAATRQVAATTSQLPPSGEEKQ
jgi:hypothetical protein